MNMKDIIRLIIPQRIRYFIVTIMPKIQKINTYNLQNPVIIKDLAPIDRKYLIRKVCWSDEEALKKAHLSRGPYSYRRKIPPRLNSPEWVGLAVFDTRTGDIAYISWVITDSIPYLEEFGITLIDNQCLLKDGYCVPAHRHQGLHTRMEQERINYCVRKGASEIFIQIHNSNKAGKDSVLNNGYTLFQQNLILYWNRLNVYRELYSFLKAPFRKVLK